MKRYVFFILVLFAIFGKVRAQSKYHVDLDYHYNLGFSENFIGKHYGRDDYKMGGNSLRLAARYDISIVLSAGVGIGLERYTEPDFNTFPIYATLRYSPLEKDHRAYMFSDVGYAVKIAEDFYPGFTGKIGVGYVIPIAKRFGINFQIAYDYKDFRKITTIRYDEESRQNIFYDSSSIRHSISFGVGVTF